MINVKLRHIKFCAVLMFVLAATKASVQKVQAQPDIQLFQEFSTPNSGLLQVPTGEGLVSDETNELLLRTGISQEVRIFGFDQLTNINLTEQEFFQKLFNFLSLVRETTSPIELDNVQFLAGYSACYKENPEVTHLRAILDTLISKANQDNFDILQALKVASVESLDINVALSSFIPDLSSSLEQDFDEVGAPGDGADRGRSHTVSGDIARLDYIFADGGGRFATLNNSYTAREIARRQLLDTVQVVNFNVASTYYNLIEDISIKNAQVRSLVDRIQTFQAAKDRAIRMAEEAHPDLSDRMLQDMVSNNVDVIRAFREFQTSLLLFLDAEENLIAQQVALAILVNDDLFPAYSLSTGLLEEFVDPVTLRAFDQFTEVSRGEIIGQSTQLFQPLRIEDNEIDIFENTVAIERSTVLPTLTGSAAFTTRNDLFDNGGFDTGYTLSTRVTFPFFDGGQTIAEVKQARLNVGIQELVKDEAELGLRGGVIEAERDNNITLLALRNVDNLPLELSINDFDMVLRNYLAGVKGVGITDVISASNSRRDAEIANAGRTLEYLISLLQLQRFTNRMPSPIHVNVQKYLNDDIDEISERLICQPS